MIVTEFDREDAILKMQLADMLAQTWPSQYKKNPLDEVNSLMEADRVAIAALEDDELIGFVGAIPQYQQTGWELHPLIVADGHRKKRIGSRLLAFLEDEVASRGGITLYLGADDEKDQTSLSQIDNFANPLEALTKIKNLANHPYEFYEKQGYQLVGLIPDANGWGKPDLLMAKRIATPPLNFQKEN